MDLKQCDEEYVKLCLYYKMSLLAIEFLKNIYKMTTVEAIKYIEGIRS